MPTGRHVATATLPSLWASLSCTLELPPGRDQITTWRFELQCGSATASCQDFEYRGHDFVEFFERLARDSQQSKDALEWTGLEGWLKLRAELPGSLDSFPLRVSMRGLDADEPWQLTASVLVEPATLERFAHELRGLVRYA